MSERWKPSVTVAAIASRSRAGRTEYLLVEEETTDGLRLNNPAGHLDPGESPQEAVVREALEETARAFAPERLVGVYLARLPLAGAPGGDVTYLRFAFAGMVGEPDPRRSLDTGIVRTLWMTLDELRASRPRHRSPLLLRSVEDAAAGRSFPLDAIVTDPSVHRPGGGGADGAS
ncbi:MAG: NUDIX hydrolase [Caldimonas sp.]